MSTPTFVVGTGRCGSTMLSNMLREHPKVLSLSEFFAVASDGSYSSTPFSPEAMDGRRFWQIIAAKTPWLSFCFRNGIRCEEWLYRHDAPSARFTSQTGVPAILITTLPHLTSEHEHLFDLLSDEVPAWPTATIGEHYRHLFGWLAAHFGKQLWIERSGGGIGHAPELMSMFADARFIHVVRDGRDSAISMQKHPAFRVGHLTMLLEHCLGVNPITSQDRTHVDRVPPELRAFLPERFDLAALDAYPVTLSFSGEVWSKWIEKGIADLSTLCADRLLTLRYEDFFTDPKRQLDTLAAFLGDDYVDEDWSTRCAATVRKPKSTWRDLPEDEARALTEACRPGFELLRQIGVEYYV